MMGRFEVHALPDGSVIYYDEKAHRYFSAIKPAAKAGEYSYVQGSQLPGVSTISKYVDPPGDGLLYWAAGLDQQGIADCAERDRLAGADLTWLTDAEKIKQRLRDEKKQWKDVRDATANRGTNVHEFALNELAKGNVPNLADFTEEERSYGQAVISWWRDRQPDVLYAEQVTASLSKGFGGRFDLLCVFNVNGVDARVLVDAKTREGGKVRMSDHVQLAGYETANVDCGIGASEYQLALILMPDGCYREEWCLSPEAHFHSALNAYMSNKHLGKAMREAEKETREKAAA